MEDRKNMQQEIEKMQKQIDRLQAVLDIQNLMGRYETLLAPQTMERVAPETFAMWRPDVSMEVSDRGVYVGPEAVQTLFAKHMGTDNEPQIDGKPDLHGALYLHHINTPMIEVAGDGQTAHAVWYSSGVETPFNVETGKRQAKWCWGKYSVEFIRGDQGWRIWHMHWFRGFMNDYYSSWVDDYQNDAKAKRDPKQQLNIQPTTYHRPYDPTKDVLPVPRNPKPYETHVDSKWIYEDWLKEE